MKNVTKLVVGAGLAALSLGALALPANAVETAPTANTQAAGDRVQGPLILLNGVAYGDNTVYYSFATGTEGEKIKSYKDLDLNVALSKTGEYSFPAKGAGAGPIIDANGLCMAAPEMPFTLSKGYVTSEICDGSARQQFEYTADNHLRHVASGKNLTNTDSGSNVAFLTPNTPGNRVYTDLLTPVDVIEAAPVTLDGPTAGESVEDTTPTFSGTGEPGATIVVKDEDGNELCSTTVGADGNWACDSTIELPMGENTVTAEQTDADGNTTSDEVTFIVADGEGIPAMNPALAGGIASLALLAAAGTLITRRKTRA